MKETTGKVAFVTGGANGIGLGMAKAFLEAGIKVAIADIREDRLHRIEPQLRKISDDLLALRCDVVDADAISRAADEIEEKLGPVQICCNNAGIGLGGPFHAFEESAWQRILDVNLWSVIRGGREFSNRLINSGLDGHIVNTASIMGMITGPGSAAYCATKHAVVAISECMSEELKQHQIGVSVLCPFIVDTSIFYPDLDDDDHEAIEERKKNSPLHKFALEPQYVGELVLRAIHENELHIFCDGTETPGMVKSRFDRVTSAFARQFPESPNA
ncbi:MAG: SDR family NAD(P)-dependent oxidoreductase [Gammaproteobacteria bacterium]|nr:SDR family NAD(P)-dependent oxidoreductase [Gammaproteobacteria bacterium]